MQPERRSPPVWSPYAARLLQIYKSEAFWSWTGRQISAWWEFPPAGYRTPPRPVWRAPGGPAHGPLALEPRTCTQHGYRTPQVSVWCTTQVTHPYNWPSVVEEAEERRILLETSSTLLRTLNPTDTDLVSKAGGQVNTAYLTADSI